MKLNAQKLGITILIVFGCLSLIHLLILFDVIPKELIWDTTITDRASVVMASCITLAFFAFCMLTILARIGYLPLNTLDRISDSMLIAMAVYFLLNIVGYFMSDSPLKKLLYTPLTIIFILMLLLLFASRRNPPDRKKQNLSEKATSKTKRSRNRRG